METIKSYRPLEVFCKGSRKMELQLGEDSAGFCFGWTVSCSVAVVLMMGMIQFKGKDMRGYN